jgi:hypothetical protein
MSKKSKKELLGKRGYIIKYKWEFLRRNKKYNQDYLSRGKLSSDYWLKEYGISMSFDPKKKHSNLSRKSLERFLFEGSLDNVPTIVVKDVSTVPMNEGDENYQDEASNKLNFQGEEYASKVATLKLLVNVLKKKEDIVSRFERIISAVKDNIIKKPLLAKKAQWAMYDTYLAVYDLRHPKSGKRRTFSQIARVVYPNDSDLESSLRKINRNYEEAKKLVEGGYRYIE